MNRKPLIDRRARSLSSLAGHTGMEPLEGRALLAAVSWTGNAGDNLWNTPGNWSTNVVPGSADDVTIDVAANPTIRFTNVDRTINSLLTREALQFENHVLTINTTAVADGVAVTMQGGTLQGGSWSYLNGGSLAFTSSGGLLKDVATNTDLQLNGASKYIVVDGTTSFTSARLTASASAFYMAPGYTLNSLVSVEGAATGTRSIYMAYGGVGTATIGATGIIRLAAGSGGGLNINNSSAATLNNNGLISAEASGQTLTMNVTTFNNNKTLSAAAGTLNVSTTTMTGGAASATNVETGATLTLGATNWTNAGTLAVNGGTLNLDGTFPTTGFNFAGFSRSGGTVNLKGTLTNTGATLALNAATGSWVMLGGAITNGSVSFAGGSTLTPTASGGTLNSVAVGGELLVNVSSAYFILSGTTTFTAMRLSASNSAAYMAPGYTLNSLVTAEGAAAGTRTIYMAYGGVGTVTIGATGIIRLASGSGGALNVNNSSTATLVNNGLISAEATGLTLTLNVTNFTHNKDAGAIAGTLNVNTTTMTGAVGSTFSAASGATLRLGANNWTNAGTISITSATLNLDGTFTTAGFNFAGFSRTGGTVNLVGTLTNTAATLALNAATGSWVMLGGVINGGSVTQTGGSTLLTSTSGGTLTNVAVSGDLIVSGSSAYFVVGGTTTFGVARLQANASGLYMTPGYTLTNSVIAEGAATGTRSIYMAYGGVGTVTIASTGVVQLAAGAGGGLTLQNSSTSTLINNGLISAEAAGQTLTINNTTFTNNATGTVQALAGTLRINATSYTNAGTFKVATGATLNLDGTFNATGGVGTLVNTGTGSIDVTGTITNTGNTIALTAATGSLNLRGGVINNGSITFAGGTFLLGTSSGGTLNSVALGGEMILNTTSAYVILGGTTTFTTARLQANNAGLYLTPGYTMNNTIVVEGATTGARFVTLAYGGVGTVTFGPSASVRVLAGAGAGLNIQNSSVATLINNGLISNEEPAATLGLNNSTFTNNGTVQALAGTVSVNNTTYTNTGTFKVATGATLGLDGGFNATGGIGTFFNTGTGVTRVGGNGTITNTGNTITLNATTGSWTMSSGTILNGSVNLTAGTQLLTTSSGGTLDNVAVTGEIILSTTSAYVIMAGATTFTAARLQANNTTIYMAPGSTLNSLVSAEGAAAGTRNITLAYGGAGTVTFGPSAIVRLASGAGAGLSIQNSSTATLINNGMITAEAAGQTLTINNSTLNNGAGTIQALAGTLSVNNTSYTNTGTFKVATGATLGLDGGFNATGGIGTFINTGTGVTRVGGNGTITNTGNTITLNATTGSWTMSSGTILNGSVNLTAGTQLLTTSSGGTLNNVAVTGEVILNTTSSYIILAGATTFTAARLQANNTSIYMAPGSTLNSLVSAEGAAAGTRNLVLAYGGAGTVTFGPSAIVRLASGAGAGLNIQNSSVATLVNNGLITAEAAGQTLTISNSTLNNGTGTIQALAGTLSVNNTTYTNTGTFKVATGATLGLDGGFNATGGIGTFINTGTGVTRVGGGGTITNTGNTITLNATTGSWTMANGTISGGSLILTGGTSLLSTSSGGTLSNLAVTGDLVANVTSAYFILTGTTSFTTARLQANNTGLYLPPGYTLNDTVIVEGAPAGARFITAAYGGVGTLTLGNTAVVRIAAGAGAGLNIQNSSVATLINNGLIQGQAVGQGLNINTTTFTNNGTIDAAGSNITLSSTTLTNFAGNALNGGVWKASNGGSLTGGASANVKVINVNVVLDGANKGWDALNKLETIPAGVTFQLTGGTDQTVVPASGLFTNSGTLILGLGSRLLITGNFRQVAGATLEAHIAGGNPLTNYGSVIATGTGQLDGTLNIIADNGYIPSRPDAQDVVKTTGSTTGTFANVTYPVTNNPEWATYFIYTGNGVQLLTTSIIDFNIDGQVDLEDFFIFFNKWDTFDPTLDLNNDGGVDLGDFFLFFNLWDQG